jgi:hypothetical protein
VTAEEWLAAERAAAAEDDARRAVEEHDLDDHRATDVPDRAPDVDDADDRADAVEAPPADIREVAGPSRGNVTRTRFARPRPRTPRTQRPALDLR